MATQFRKRGFSYSEIAKLCGVSKATVSNWLKGKKFSKEVKETNIRRAADENTKRLALINKARQSERNTRYQEAIKAAETEFKHYKHNPLFIAGLMIYQAAGDRKSGQIRLSTGCMESQRVFIRFLREYLGVSNEQIRFWLLLYHTHNETDCARKWSKQFKLSTNRFGKTQVVPGRTSDTLQFGVGNTIIGDTVLRHKLDHWIKLAAKEL